NSNVEKKEQINPVGVIHKEEIDKQNGERLIELKMRTSTEQNACGFENTEIGPSEQTLSPPSSSLTPTLKNHTNAHDSLARTPQKKKRVHWDAMPDYTRPSESSFTYPEPSDYIPTTLAAPRIKSSILTREIMCIIGLIIPW